MKKIIVAIFMLIAIPLSLAGQSKEINDLLDKYEKRKAVQSVTVSSDLILMAGKSGDWGDKLSKIRIVSVDSNVYENNVPLRVTFKQEMFELVERLKFVSTLKIKDGDDEVEMFVNQKQNGALLFLNSSNKEFAVIAMFGNIDDKLIKTAINGGISIR
jgi:hypothetical protein